MGDCLGNIPELKFRSLRAGLRVALGLLMTVGLISGAYYIDGLRAHFEGMTSFTPLALIFTIVLSPLWIGLHVLAFKYYRGTGRPFVAMAIPTVIVVAVSIWAIWHFNEGILKEVQLSGHRLE